MSKDPEIAKAQAEMNRLYSSLGVVEKSFLARLLVRDGFVKDATVLSQWWAEMRFKVRYEGLKHAMDDYVQRNPQTIYLEDFDVNEMSRYRKIGPTKIAYLRKLIDKSLIKQHI